MRHGFISTLNTTKFSTPASIGILLRHNLAFSVFLLKGSHSQIWEYGVLNYVVSCPQRFV
jgi:hypothetical protein